MPAHAQEPGPARSPRPFGHTVCALLQEYSATGSPVWQDEGAACSKERMLAALQAAEPCAVRYARALAEEALEGLMRQADSSLELAAQRAGTTPQACLQQVLTEGVRPVLVALYAALPSTTVAWRFMSKTYLAPDFAADLQAGHPDALRVVSDVLRVCRDVLAHRAQA